MGAEQVKGFWALIITPSMKLIGQIAELEPGQEKDQLREAVEKGKSITVHEATEVTVNLVPVPAEGGRMALAREFGAMPIMTTLYGAPLHVFNVTALQFFDEMKEGDVDGYKRLAQNAAQHCKDAIAARSNIILGSKGKKDA